MPKFIISNTYISKCNESIAYEYPKHTTQIINLANQNAGATRPKNVGQLSDLLPEYMSTNANVSCSGWKNWYESRHPSAVDDAVDKIWIQIEKLKNCTQFIDKAMVKTWVEDLIFDKTFNGLYYQKAILQKISEYEDKPYRRATPKEEADNIDGFVGNIAFQIKPDTYDHMKFATHENIPCKIVKYKKISTGIEFEY